MLSSLALLEAEFPLLLFGIALLFGLLIGSFLNVVIYRLPVMIQNDWQAQAKEILGQEPDVETAPFNLLRPNSRCPVCETAIMPWQNIPLLSYAMLGGRCGNCQTKISIRYPLVELCTGLATGLVVMHFGANLTALMACLFTWSLIAASMIDYDHKILPDDITLPLLWLGLIVNYYELLTPFEHAFWGALLGYLALWSVYQAFKLVTGKEGMGFGDFKLLACLGAWLGWQMLPLVIILSSLAGAVIGGLLILFGRDRSNPIPFGPFLALAGWIALLWGQPLTMAYLKILG